MIIACFLLFLIFALFFCLNALVKRTNWYNNIFINTKQILSNKVNGNNKPGNFKIVNVGSNPALFAFEYENAIGQNWATGTQGPEMDFEILKSYHSFIEKGGVVLLPIVPFSSCTPFLWHHKKYALGKYYYARFAKVIGRDVQAERVIPNYVKVKRWMDFPLFYSPFILKWLIKDVPIDNRLSLDHQQFTGGKLLEDANKWMKVWKEEFDIHNLEADLGDIMRSCQKECVDIFVEIIHFCKERSLTPVLIIPPITKELNSCFNERIKQLYIYSFIRKIQEKEPVLFMDYMSDKSFMDSSLFFNSLFLNLRGRRLFTKRVLEDLSIVK